MILKNELYTIQSHEVTASGHSYTLRLTPDSFIYQAHSPGEPITPGVCLMQIGKELLEDALQLQLDVKTVKNAKFLSVVSPKETTELTCTLGKIEHLATGSQVKAQITMATGSEPKAKISIICTKV